MGEGAKKTRAASSGQQLAAMLAKFTPEIVAFSKAARTRLRRHVPGGTEFVYDNYNFFVIGYGPSERPSEAVLSLAHSARKVTLCFLKGARLADPKKLLRGSGNIVRNVQLPAPEHIDHPDVRRLIQLAVAAAEPPFPGGRIRTVIRSVSAKQRPRRPA